MRSTRLDAARDAFAAIVADVQDRLDDIATEADARIQIINRVLTDVLFWPLANIKTEPHTDSGFIDYLIRDGERNAMVVEAKRTSTPLIDTVKAGYFTAKLGGAALQSAVDGIKQTRSYSTDASVGFAALTSGLAWVGFRPIRDDGLDPKRGVAHIFPTLSSIEADFAAFYDLFSREGIAEKRFLILTDRAEGASVVHYGELYSPVPDSLVSLAPKTQLAIDLDGVFDRFFRSITNDRDTEMLVECFVESKESRQADAALQKITRDIVASIQPLATSAGDQLTREIEAVLQTRYADIVLIVGNKGAGKTTFVSRFFNIVLPRDLRDKCLVLQVDLADAMADIDGIESWLTRQLLAKIDKELFEDGVPTYDQLQGVFFADYQRWSKGERRHLYESDHQSFKIQFGEYMSKEATERPHEYLMRLLKSAANQRGLLPCIVFDNTDQFPQAFQERVFQYAHALYRAVTSFIVVPITDRTIWQLSKSGPLQSYSTKSFFLPIPSTKDILEKRVNFIRRKISSVKNPGEYFLNKGIRLSIENLNAFASAVEHVFVSEDYISRRVSWLANLDIRRSLELTHRIITSPILRIDQLVTTYITGQMPDIPRDRIIRALIRGSHTFYSPSDNSFVTNLFLVSRDNVTSPMLMLSILRLLTDKAGSTEDIAQQYLTVEIISNYFEAMGVRSAVIYATLPLLLKTRAIEPYDPTEERIDAIQRVRITFAGRMHMEMALGDHQYISEMALRTPIRDEAVSASIRRLHNGFHDGEAFRQIRSLFSTYCVLEDGRFMQVPSDNAYFGQRRMRDDFASKWGVSHADVM
jgi:hypothetical protein